MAQVVLPFSMSLDGFVAGPDVSMDRAMGVGGDRLHEWMFKAAPGSPDAGVAAGLLARAGAVVLGRRTFDLGLQHWRGDTPYPAPSFVVTHRRRAPLPMISAAFAFVTEGVQSAIQQASAAAGDRDVIVMGAETARQCLAAGLVDELHIQLVPLMLGAGTRLMQGIEATWEIVEVAASPTVTHLRYRPAGG
jgi:dihydrofolate reductase